MGGMEPGGRCSDPALWCEPGQSLSLPEPQFPDLRSGTARTCPASRSHAMGVGMITAWPPLPPAPVGQLLPLGRRSPEGAPWRTWHSRGARPKHQPVHLSPQRAADSHLVEVSPPTPFWFNWKTRPGPTSRQDVFDGRELAGFVGTGLRGPTGQASLCLGLPGSALHSLRLKVGVGVVPAQVPPGDRPQGREGEAWRQRGAGLLEVTGLSWASWVSRCSLSEGGLDSDGIL